MIKSAICELLGIEKPIFQGGMAWIADARLAAAVSNAGGLGLISSINFGTEAVRAEIRKARELTDKPFGVNIMLAAPNAAEIAELVVEEGIRIVTTGAGSPAAYMPAWQAAGIMVIPVVASVDKSKVDDTTFAANAAKLNFVLAAFHTCFNVVNTGILIWFIPQIEKIVCRVIKHKPKEEDEESRLSFISVGLMQTPELSILNAKKEVADGTVAVSIRDRAKGNGKYYQKDAVMTVSDFLARIQKEIEEKA